MGRDVAIALTPAVVADPLDELAEIVNLARKHTGVTGTIFISTALGQHGPGVKWFPGQPSREAPCLTVTLEEPPRVLNHGLPDRVAAIASAEVTAWVHANRAALLRFWNEGLSWDRDEVDAFLDGLQRLP
jgi:hypothetical protein